MKKEKRDDIIIIIIIIIIIFREEVEIYIEEIYGPDLHQSKSMVKWRGGVTTERSSCCTV